MTNWIMTKEQIAEFHNGGFTEFEIGQINEDLRLRPQQIDPWNEQWQQVFKARLGYIRSMQRAGHTLKQIHDKLIAYVTKSRGKSPWDFIKEIGSGVKGEKKSDFSQRMEATRRIKSHFGPAYR